MNLTSNPPTPVIDLHCDLLSYLASTTNADPYNTAEIGSSFPAMRDGNVVLQVMAVFSTTEKGSVDFAVNQIKVFRELLEQYPNEVSLLDPTNLNQLTAASKTSIVASVENASGLCEEDQPLDQAFENLEKIISDTQRLLYIGLTHHAENRFGGGNYSQVGLKEDGRELLDYVSGRKIAIDLSHTSDALAYGILDHIDKNALEIPIIASHSNYRDIFEHPRNLPNELVQEVVKRKGLIGLNFVRAFVNPENPDSLFDHLNHGLGQGGEDAVCFGADYFHAGLLPDPSRHPFYFKQHENATCYPAILSAFSDRTDERMMRKLGHENASAFINRIWT